MSVVFLTSTHSIASSSCCSGLASATVCQTRALLKQQLTLTMRLPTDTEHRTETWSTSLESPRFIWHRSVLLMSQFLRCDNWGFPSPPGVTASPPFAVELKMREWKARLTMNSPSIWAVQCQTQSSTLSRSAKKKLRMQVTAYRRPCSTEPQSSSTKNSEEFSFPPSQGGRHQPLIGCEHDQVPGRSGAASPTRYSSADPIPRNESRLSFRVGFFAFPACPCHLVQLCPTFHQ